MNKQTIKAFFDNQASHWDEDLVRNEPVIKTILDNAHIKENINVLDVACGTGVLFPDYINRNANFTAIDLSEEMVKIAKEKYPKFNILCGDVETTEFSEPFDVIMIYNAFPHFPNPASLIETLANKLTPNGYLSIAHGMSREALLKHHDGKASEVSIPLLEIDELEKLFLPYFTIETKISNQEMYQIVGKKK